MRTLRGKRALVTGAASGIGRAIALELARQGTHLDLVDIDAEQLEAVCRTVAEHGVETLAYACDLSDPQQIDACVQDTLDQWSELDILVNNAGICFYGTADKTPQEVWDKVLAVNLHAPIRLTRQLLPVLQSRPEAHVLNVASMYGLLPSNRCAAYHASKYGLVGFSQALRAECGRGNVGVTALCPGFVDTSFFSSMPRDPAKCVRQPPRWLCATPESVARRAVRAIRSNRHLSVVTPLAHLLYFVQRAFPGLLVNLYGLGTSRRPREAAPAPARDFTLRIFDPSGANEQAFDERNDRYQQGTTPRLYRGGRFVGADRRQDAA